MRSCLQVLAAVIVGKSGGESRVADSVARNFRDGNALCSLAARSFLPVDIISFMGMSFFIRTDDDFCERCVMGSMGASRATLFFNIAKIIERKLQQSCGLIDNSDSDEYWVNSSEFIKFVECFMSYVWLGERVQYLYNWAEYAAGMIEIITLQPRMWKHRHGPVLRPIRYALINQEAAADFDKKLETIIRSKKYPKESHPEFNLLQLDDYIEIIESACLKI